MNPVTAQAFPNTGAFDICISKGELLYMHIRRSRLVSTVRPKTVLPRFWRESPPRGLLLLLIKTPGKGSEGIAWRTNKEETPTRKRLRELREGHSAWLEDIGKKELGCIHIILLIVAAGQSQGRETHSPAFAGVKSLSLFSGQEAVHLCNNRDKSCRQPQGAQKEQPDASERHRTRVRLLLR